MKKVMVVFIYAFLLVGCDWINNWVGYNDCYPLAWLPDATASKPYHTEINTGTENYSFIVFNIRDKNHEWQPTEDSGLEWKFTDLYHNPEISNDDVSYKNITIYGIPKNRYRLRDYDIKVAICSDIRRGFDCQPKYCLKINSDKDKENL